MKILQGTGKKIVFTNGCFDLIHAGHTRYLQKAKSLGDVLVVAVNSDGSVRTIKGDKRPINIEAARMETLASLECVDFVTSFEEPDPYNVIRELQPDVLVKGGDWTVEKIIGRDIVEGRGGAVISAGYVEGASTTEIIDTIVQRYCRAPKAEGGRKASGKKKASRKR